MANRRFTQFFNTLHNRPVLLDCNFVVDSANVNGLGVSSLKGPGIANVFMHTSQTPATGNPNPAAGRIVVALQDNYNGFFGSFFSILSPNSGTGISSGLTAGNPYTVTVLGNTTLAQWQVAGVPVGITPAVGVSFIALATSFTGTGRVQVPLNSGISSLEFIGTPNTTITSKAAQVLGSSSGAFLVGHFLSGKTTSQNGATHTTTTVDGLTSTLGLAVGQSVMGTGIPLGATIATIASATSITISAAATASATVPLSFPNSYGVVQPVDGSVVNLGLYFSNSSIIVKGE